MRLILHIGFEKTGTTTIQGFLTRNADGLRAAGVLYPSGLGRLNHVHLAIAVADPEQTGDIRHFNRVLPDAADRDGFARAARRRLERQVESARPETLLLSSEHFSSRLIDAGSIAALRDYLAPHSADASVVAYVRRQDDAVISAYSQYVKADGTEPLDAFDVDDRLHWLNYGSVLERWAQVFGRERIALRRFPPENGDLVGDFATAAGIRLPPDAREPETLNRSLDHANAALLADINRVLPTFVDGGLNPERTGLIGFMERRSTGPRIEVGPERRALLLAGFAEENARLSHGFLPEGQAAFDHRLPERAPPPPPDYDDAIRLAADMWRDRAALASRLDALERRSLAGRLKRARRLFRRLAKQLRIG